MRIEVLQSGGFAGIERRAALDTSGRPDAAHLHALARQVLAGGMEPFTHGSPDAFQYDVTADGRSARFFGLHLSEAQRELVTTVLKEGR
jgi:hypothetical protein